METQSTSGLLRFRSAPSSLFNEYTQNNTWSDSDKFSGRFGGDELSESYERKPQRLSNSQNGYSGQLPPQYPNQSSSGQIQRSNSLEIDQSMKQGNGGGLSLDRQSSLPSGFINHLSNHPQNGYTVMRGLGSFRVGNGSNGDESSPRMSRLGMTHLPQIPEIGIENGKEMNTAGFSLPSWNDSNSDASHLSENGGLLGRPNTLSHHLSLPNTSAEMAVIEKLLHFQDTVPFKVRAKRGCATHPRSIAERVRRNRISERMRKLQDLVPNMDKQTNTADMLDLAVDYIKSLQNQYKALSDNRAKCKCVNL